MVQQIGVRSPFFVSPGGLTGKESACNVGDLVLFPGLGRYPGEGNSCSFQYSGLENSMDYSVGSQRVGHDCNVAHYIISNIDNW